MGWQTSTSAGVYNEVLATFTGSASTTAFSIQFLFFLKLFLVLFFGIMVLYLAFSLLRSK